MYFFIIQKNIGLPLFNDKLQLQNNGRTYNIKHALRNWICVDFQTILNIAGKFFTHTAKSYPLDTHQFPVANFLKLCHTLYRPTYATFIRARSTSVRGRSWRFRASGLGVDGLWASDESRLPLSISRVRPLLTCGVKVPFISPNVGDWLLLFHVPDCCWEQNEHY
jgi:hypothetical protein